MLHIDFVSFIVHIGYIGVLVIILIENGIIAGFFLPGDTLLLAVGALASAGSLSLPLVIIYGIAGAIIGNIIGYAIGKKYGRAVFDKETNKFFKKSYVDKIEKFFNKYGNVSVFLARFIPTIRTGIPTFAGIGKMKYRNYIWLSILGGVVWVSSVTITGYYAADFFPNMKNYISLMFIGISILMTIIILKSNIYTIWNKIKKSLE